jgi:hypothetical protein
MAYLRLKNQIKTKFQIPKKPKVFIGASIYIEGGESQMRKGDKWKKVLGAIVILLVIDLRI